jgi:hypothetical protein
MDSISVLETGFLLDDLRVEELEPRLEFAYPVCPAGGCCEETLPTIWGDANGTGTTPAGCPGAA